MPLVDQVFGNESMGRKKHGGPVVSNFSCDRPDGINCSVHEMWNADGAPWVRSIFRAAPAEEDEEEEVLDPVRRTYKVIENYKQAMISQGREDEILGKPQAETNPFELRATTTELPPEALESMRLAFASNDKDAMAKAMVALNEYDPVHKSFDERLDFWMKEFSKAWSPEFQKDEQAAKHFVRDSIEPFMPAELKDMERQMEKAEARKALKREKMKDYGVTPYFPPALDLTDSALTVIQAKSSCLEWETVSLFGSHPGVMFGAHCAATVDTTPVEGFNGGFASPAQFDFARRYPKTKGRNALEGQYPEGYATMTNEQLAALQ